MNTKVKGIILLALVAVAVTSALLVAPAFAIMNGDIDQTRDNDRLRNRDYSCVCQCDQDQTRTRLQIRDRTSA
jgi:hypothetical protein